MKKTLKLIAVTMACIVLLVSCANESDEKNDTEIHSDIDTEVDVWVQETDYGDFLCIWRDEYKAGGLSCHLLNEDSRP
jgi:protein involved in sex pheromone biosynthesis